MKSTRLTNNMRKAIANAATDASPIRKEIQEARKLANAAVIKIRDHALGDDKVTFDKLPEHYFPAGCQFYVRSHARGKGVCITMSESRIRLPNVWNNHWGVNDDSPVIKTAKGEKLLDDYLAKRKQLTSLQDKLRTAKDTVKRVLESCKTTKQLIEVWPEAKRFLPNDDAPKLDNLPMEIHDLNELLGFTGKEAA